MDLVENKDMLEHLLKLEEEASSMIIEAQAEADKRTAEAEKKSRSLHDEIYTARAMHLEEAYLERIALLRDAYKKQLDEYRNELNGQSADNDGFSCLAHKYLLEDA